MTDLDALHLAINEELYKTKGKVYGGDKTLLRSDRYASISERRCVRSSKNITGEWKWNSQSCAVRRLN